MRAGAQSLGTLFGSAGSRSYGDVLLVFGVVAIITLMILPLPLVVMDALVAASILFGVTLLLLSIYVPSPLAFSSFPSVILLSTLFRLALSIAITRLILLDADAGNIVDTFGSVVAGGNLVVGIVVFLIITVVQFIVVAKGAERVAEVAARFSLDAMPGKQLSIDSDLRTGLIDKDEGRRRRRELGLESQLHGSLDGAMKFVKGDAVAGIVIIIINIIAGLAIGVLQREMSVGEAMRTYSILTIGDGLVAQIPALLTAIAAGLIVTRTASDDRDGHLGEAIGRQILQHPRVLLIGGLLALLLTMVPGFPWPVFALMGLALLGAWCWRERHRLMPVRKLLGIPADAGSPDPLVAQDDLPPPPAMLLVVEGNSLATLGPDRVQSAINAEIGAIREEFGVPVPLPVVRSDPTLPAGSYHVLGHGMRLAAGRLQGGDHLRIGHDAAPEPSHSQGAGGTATAFAAQEVETPDPTAAMASHAARGIKRQLALFLGIQEALNLANRWGRDYPDLTKEMLRVVPPQRVAELLRRLTAEGIPIRNLRDVFEAITDAAGREKDSVLLYEQVRAMLRRQISERFSDDDRNMRALLAHPELEENLRQALRNTENSAQIAIDPDLLERVLTQLREQRASFGEELSGVVLLCSGDVRRHLRRLIESEFFELPVIAFQELAGDVRVHPEAQIQG